MAAGQRLIALASMLLLITAHQCRAAPAGNAEAAPLPLDGWLGRGLAGDVRAAGDADNPILADANVLELSNASGLTNAGVLTNTNILANPITVVCIALLEPKLLT